jgi:PIN domain nuclease of toxin-antitoxin system
MTAGGRELLLDTHVLIWMVEADHRLSDATKDLLRQGSREAALVVSAITPWEIALLVEKKRVKLKSDVQVWIDTALGLQGIRLEPLSPAIAVASTRLPWEMHGDPADRILAATARHLGATLITADELLLKAGAEGNLWVRAAG